MTPLGVILLMWLWPAICRIRCKPHIQGARIAAKLTLLGLEMITPSVTTSILQTFACDEYDDGWFLRAELTIQCGRSNAHRRLWLFFAGLMVAVYPFGVPMLLFSLMYTHRSGIGKLQRALKDHDSNQSIINMVSAKQMTKQLSMKRKRKSVVLAEENLTWLVKKFEKFVSICDYVDPQYRFTDEIVAWARSNRATGTWWFFCLYFVSLKLASS